MNDRIKDIGIQFCLTGIIIIIIMDFIFTLISRVKLCSRVFTMAKWTKM